jgi:hypothetical protein
MLFTSSSFLFFSFFLLLLFFGSLTNVKLVRRVGIKKMTNNQVVLNALLAKFLHLHKHQLNVQIVTMVIISIYLDKQHAHHVYLVRFLLVTINHIQVVKIALKAFTRLHSPPLRALLVLLVNIKINVNKLNVRIVLQVNIVIQQDKLHVQYVVVVVVQQMEIHSYLIKTKKVKERIFLLFFFFNILFFVTNFNIFISTLIAIYRSINM